MRTTTRRRTRRYTVTTSPSGAVRLTVTHPWLLADFGHTDDELVIDYDAVGGYVYDVTHHPGTSGQQVCDRLHYRGGTLTAPRDGDLAGLIRREMRARVARWEREMAREHPYSDFWR